MCGESIFFCKKTEAEYKVIIGELFLRLGIRWCPEMVKFLSRVISRHDPIRMLPSETSLYQLLCHETSGEEFKEEPLLQIADDALILAGFFQQYDDDVRTAVRTGKAALQQLSLYYLKNLPDWNRYKFFSETSLGFEGMVVASWFLGQRLDPYRETDVALAESYVKDLNPGAAITVFEKNCSTPKNFF